MALRSLTRNGARSPNATSALSVMSPFALGRLISAVTIFIGSVASMRSIATGSPSMLTASAPPMAGCSSASHVTAVVSRAVPAMSPRFAASEAAEHAYPVTMIGQNLEQFAVAEPVLDAAPPLGGQDLTMRLEEHVLEVGVESEEIQERFREHVVVGDVVPRLGHELVFLVL